MKLALIANHVYENLTKSIGVHNVQRFNARTCHTVFKRQGR